jgi:hypothetical protein
MSNFLSELPNLKHTVALCIDISNSNTCNKKFANVVTSDETLLSRCQGTWTETCTFQYLPGTGSIKQSLEHFQLYRFGRS